MVRECRIVQGAGMFEQVGMLKRRVLVKAARIVTTLRFFEKLGLVKTLGCSNE